MVGVAKQTPTSNTPNTPTKDLKSEDKSVEHNTTSNVSKTNDDETKYRVLAQCGFKVRDTLGSGSYAVVKSAYSEKHHREVAIKIISKKKAPADYLQKFLPRELDVVRILKHSCIVTFYQAIETDKNTYLVMEKANKGDLLTEVRSQKYIKEPQSGIWFAQLVDGVEYCHKHEVAHRDLKCENLLLDDKHNIKITDFGFARGNITKNILSETYCGSYAYAAPEILTGQPYHPFLVDVWSMGVVLYIMVVGRLPFDDNCHQKLLKEVKRGPIFPENKGESTPECKALIVKILVKRESRPNCTELKSEPWVEKHFDIINKKKGV